MSYFSRLDIFQKECIFRDAGLGDKFSVSCGKDDILSLDSVLFVCDLGKVEFKDHIVLVILVDCANDKWIAGRGFGCNNADGQ